MRPYSIDLRIRVVNAYNRSEGTIPEIAERFSVHERTVENWLRKLRETGSVAPKPDLGGRKSKLDEGDLSLLRRLLASQPDLFLDELCDKLAHSRGVRVHRSTMSRILQRIRLPRKKKSLGADEADGEDSEKALERYFVQVSPIHSEFLVFLDEMGIQYNLTRQYGRAAPGRRVSGSVPFKGGGRTTLLGAMDIDGPLTEIAFPGYLNTEIFRLFMRDYLAPKLFSGQIVVMDNLKIHKDPLARSYVEKVGATVLDLPPYMPELNPIENCWSKLKHLIRSLAPRTFDEVVDAIAQALKAISPSNAAGWYHHCGLMV